VDDIYAKALIFEEERRGEEKVSLLKVCEVTI
jgi:hypothetical protein